MMFRFKSIRSNLLLALATLPLAGAVVITGGGKFTATGVDATLPPALDTMTE